MNILKKISCDFGRCIPISDTDNIVQQTKCSKCVPPLHQNHRSDNHSIAGQAIVEYVLILTVLVFVGGGLLFTFNKGVQAWGKALLGTDGYFACLLQTGLLPMQNRPGAECGSPADSAKAFKDMDLTLPSSGGGGGSNPSSPSGSTNNSSSNKLSNNKSDSSSSTNENENGNTYPTSNRRTASKPTRSAGKNSSTYQPSGQLITNNKLNNLDDMASNTTYTKRNRRKKNRRLTVKKNKPGFKGYESENKNKRYTQVYSGGFLTEKEEQEQRSRAIAVASLGKKNNLTSHKKKPMRLVKKLKTKTQKDLEIGDWSFGNIFRFVLIIGILCIIAFLIANQTNSVRKALK